MITNLFISLPESNFAEQITKFFKILEDEERAWSQLCHANSYLKRHVRKLNKFFSRICNHKINLKNKLDLDSPQGEKSKFSIDFKKLLYDQRNIILGNKERFCLKSFNLNELPFLNLNKQLVLHYLSFDYCGKLIYYENEREDEEILSSPENSDENSEESLTVVKIMIDIIKFIANLTNAYSLEDYNIAHQPVTSHHTSHTPIIFQFPAAEVTIKKLIHLISKKEIIDKEDSFEHLNFVIMILDPLRIVLRMPDLYDHFFFGKRLKDLEEKNEIIFFEKKMFTEILFKNEFFKKIICEDYFKQNFCPFIKKYKKNS